MEEWDGVKDVVAERRCKETMTLLMNDEWGETMTVYVCLNSRSMYVKYGYESESGCGDCMCTL